MFRSWKVAAKPVCPTKDLVKFIRLMEITKRFRWSFHALFKNRLATWELSLTGESSNVTQFQFPKAPARWRARRRRKQKVTSVFPQLERSNLFTNFHASQSIKGGNSSESWKVITQSDCGKIVCHYFTCKHHWWHSAAVRMTCWWRTWLTLLIFLIPRGDAPLTSHAIIS